MSMEFKYEKKKLDEILGKLEETLEGEELRLKALPRQYGNNPRLLQSLMGLTSSKVHAIKKHISKPYFARIDFTGEDGKKEQLYIGKTGVINLDGETVVTDWRAPIASLYYDSNLGIAEYMAPEGIIKGELGLKRQIVIEKQELKEIFDVDSVSDDELLKPYLGASADNRLKNIVASIQKEQNDIIRMPLGKNLIVQGVAGSGKTTVALHRIAYLIYNYAKKYRSDQFMVIGPNKFFINYISSVLPDLETGEVRQYTYEELAKKVVDEEFTVNDPTDKLVSVLENGFGSVVPKYKLSMEYKKELESFLDELLMDTVSEDGVTINGFCLCSKSEVLEIFANCFEEDFSSKIHKARMVIENKVINSQEQYVTRVNEYFKNLIENAGTDAEKKELVKKWSQAMDVLKDGLKKHMKKEIKLNSKKVLAIYKKFIKEYKKYTLNPAICSELTKETKNNIKKKEFDFEDLPALMYIKLKLFGNAEFKDMAHTVVDESQDFGAFNFFVLRSLMHDSTFSIFGDLTQGIYEHRSIDSWEEVVEDVFNGKCDLMVLEKSYRTTIEIMLAANLVSSSIGLFEGKPVIRHGSDVTLTKVSKSNKAKYILESIDKYTSLNYNSLAIICKTPEESKNLFDELSKYHQKITLISGDNETYEGGICVVPAHLSKGLEFDCVILYDADENVYSSKNKVDMKLLYVAMTRALHTLDIMYTTKVSKPLEKTS